MILIIYNVCISNDSNESNNINIIIINDMYNGIISNVILLMKMKY